MKELIQLWILTNSFNETIVEPNIRFFWNVILKNAPGCPLSNKQVSKQKKKWKFPCCSGLCCSGTESQIRINKFCCSAIYLFQ